MKLRKMTRWNYSKSVRIELEALLEKPLADYLSDSEKKELGKHLIKSLVVEVKTH